MYAWNENFILPLSHDEVVHGKGSLLSKMPGDRWQQLANLRSLFAYMWAHPGKKLLFMGGELATPWEWNHADELPWFLLEHAEHTGVRDLVRDANRIYRDEPAFWEVDFSHEGFRWIEPNDADEQRPRLRARLARRRRGRWCASRTSRRWRARATASASRSRRVEELLNTDSTFYGGGGVGNMGRVTAEDVPWHDQPFSALVTLPPLGVIWLRPAAA